MDGDPDHPLCPDWVFLNNSNVHVAKDRGWFKTYTPFASTVDCSPFILPSRHAPVLGIGSVEIPTKRSPNLSGVSSHGSLLLKEVLHVPDFICNVIGQPIIFSDGYNVTTSFGRKSNGSITNAMGRNEAYFDAKQRLFSIKVRSLPNGPVLGPHVFKENCVYMLGCQWSPVEQRKWQELKDESGVGGVRSPADIPPYTDDEKVYLKENFRSEFHLLQQYGLSIHKEEDRVEGRQILRAIMNEDLSEEEPESDEFDFEGHQADYNFTPVQLDWIERHYGNSERFMVCYGLKFYDNDDLEEAKAIVNVMMEEDS